MQLRGIIFDLDGTLVDSRLDFAQMRREMGLSPEQPILEGLAAMCPGPDKDRCLEVLHEHERQGAERATLIPFVADFLAELHRRDIRQAVLTRNSRRATQAVLSRLDLQFDLVSTREDHPPKPDPAGLLHICQVWNVAPGDVLFFGDYLFDLHAGRNAGIRTVLYAPEGASPYAAEADHVIGCYREAIELVGNLLNK